MTAAFQLPSDLQSRISSHIPVPHFSPKPCLRFAGTTYSFTTLQRFLNLSSLSHTIALVLHFRLPWAHPHGDSQPVCTHGSRRSFDAG